MSKLIELSQALYKHMSEVGAARYAEAEEGTPVELCSQEEAEALAAMVALALMFMGTTNADKTLAALNAVIDDVVEGR